MRSVSTYTSTLKFLPFLLSFSIVSLARLFQSERFVYSACSQEKFVAGSPSQISLNSFFQSVLSSSSQVRYNSFALNNQTSKEPLFGLFQCRGDLRPTDCSRCIQSAVNQIAILCPSSSGASLQLEACTLRYDDVNFLGVPDTSVVYKKCSQGSKAKDLEFFQRRDDVLTDLQTAVGFKVSSSGFVQGFGQCLGDLGSSDCSSCLIQAVGNLKTLCGPAAAADVFLGQCSAKYWASGYYDVSSNPNKEDGVGKSVAIAIGITAAVAVLIVLLSVCQTIRR